MEAAGSARRLTIFISEADTYGHHSLASEIVERARKAGIAGATVLRGIEGFGLSHEIHTTRVLSLSNELPILVMIIDAPDRIDAFMPELDEVVTHGLVVSEDLAIVKYVGRAPAS